MLKKLIFETTNARAFYKRKPFSKTGIFGKTKICTLETTWVIMHAIFMHTFYCEAEERQNGL